MLMSTAPFSPGQQLIASVRHTVLLVCIFLALTIGGALFQRHAQSTPGVPLSICCSKSSRSCA